MSRQQTLVPATALAAAAALALACGSRPPPAAAPPAPVVAPEPAAAAADAPAPARERFSNPGGMWMPQQLSAHAAILEKLGLEIDPAALADPTRAPLGAVVFLGGCTASFVSPDGLVVTNHHCVQGGLQFNSTAEHNLIRDGFLARTRAEEKSIGPGAKLWVTSKLVDVTERMRAGLDQLADDLQRYDEIEKRSKELTAACEKDRPDVRCRVASFFEGAQYIQIEQLEIKDVRLVYVPARGIGNFGGDIDNWMWPRHTGDYSFLRAYVGKDGKPANYAPDNVPFHPAMHLRIASRPLQEGDLVLVAGYPGRTYRLRTAYEVKESAEWRIPHSIDLLRAWIKTLEEVAKGKPELAIKVAFRLQMLNNSLKADEGLTANFQGGLIQDKERTEAGLRAWIAADPARKARYGGVLDEIEARLAEQSKTRERDSAFSMIQRASTLLAAADDIVRMAEERPKPDADRDPDYQQRNWERTEQSMVRRQKSYDRAIDRAVLRLALVRAAALPAADRPEALAILVGKGEPTEAAIDRALDRLYAKTKLEDPEVRVKLYRTATLAQLKRSKDPFVRAALAIRPIAKRMDDEDKRLAGALALLRPRFLTALKEFRGGMLAPDANATLRVTYGTVLPSPKGGLPFTTATQMAAKATGKDPFDAPARLLEAVRARRFGPYAAAALDGAMPVDFLSDVDTTGGNSGSPTLNARGELVGLLFDGTYETMGSDYLYMPKVTRSIHTDIRYVLWIMDAVDGADALLEEMGVKPAID